MKRKAIIIGEEPQKESKGIEITHYLNPDEGWEEFKEPQIEECNKIVYLGDCDADGQMFALYTDNGLIEIFKGNLNDGTY